MFKIGATIFVLFFVGVANSKGMNWGYQLMEWTFMAGCVWVIWCTILFFKSCNRSADQIGQYIASQNQRKEQQREIDLQIKLENLKQLKKQNRKW